MYNIHFNFSWYVFVPFCTFPLHFLIRWHIYWGWSLFFSFLAQYLPFHFFGGELSFSFLPIIFLILNAQTYISCFLNESFWFNFHTVIRAWIILRVVDALHYFTDIFINASGNDTEPWMCDIGNNNSRCITCNAWWEVFASSCCG